MADRYQTTDLRQEMLQIPHPLKDSGPVAMQSQGASEHDRPVRNGAFIDG